MAEGASVAAANAFLAAVFQGTSFALGDGWIKFHVGAPGPAGTANPAGETRRVAAFATPFGTDPASGVIANDGSIGPLLAVSTTEVWSHWSYWDDSTAGTFWFSGTLTGGSVTAGDDVTIAVGQLTVTVPSAA